MAGLEQLIEYMNNLTFTEEDIDYLRSLNLFRDDFIDYLRDFKFCCDVCIVIFFHCKTKRIVMNFYRCTVRISCCNFNRVVVRI